MGGDGEPVLPWDKQGRALALQRTRLGSAAGLPVLGPAKAVNSLTVCDDHPSTALPRLGLWRVRAQLCLPTAVLPIPPLPLPIDGLFGRAASA